MIENLCVERTNFIIVSFQGVFYKPFPMSDLKLVLPFQKAMKFRVGRHFWDRLVLFPHFTDEVTDILRISFEKKKPHRVQKPRIKDTCWSFPPRTEPRSWVVFHNAHFPVLWFWFTFFTNPHLCEIGASEPIFSLLFWHKPKFRLVINLVRKNAIACHSSSFQFAHLSLEVFAKKTSWGTLHEETKRLTWFVCTPFFIHFQYDFTSLSLFYWGSSGLRGQEDEFQGLGRARFEFSTY